MTFKNMRDIERDKEAKEREEFKSKITKDTDDVIKNLLGNFEKRKKERKKEQSIFYKILKLLGIIGLGLLVINLIIGNIWLLNFFIKSLFGLE